MLDDTADVREATDGAGADVDPRLRRHRRDACGRASTSLARRGLYSTVGYGGTITVPSVAMVVGETHDRREPRRQLDRPLGADAAARAGDVTLRTETHPLEAVNDVLDALREGEVTGRAVLVP